jgi:hypothetical protein
MSGMSMDEALKLVRRVPIFPCGPDKRPLVPRGFKDATCDPAVIEACWQQWPDALIGVPTGSKFVAVDADLQHPEALAWLELNRSRLPLTRTHFTRSGGRHYLFRPHPDVKCTAGKLHPHIDTRGLGGFIIWWPAEGFDVLHGGVLADVPDWILAALRPKPANVVHLATARPVTHQQAVRQLDGIFRLVARAPEGQRNAIVHWASCRLWELIRGGELSEGAAQRFIHHAAQHNGLRELEVERTFKSACHSVKGAA